MNNWCICWLFTQIFNARLSYKSFGVKGLILVTVSLSELDFATMHTLTSDLVAVKQLPFVSVIFESKLTCLEWKIFSAGDLEKNCNVQRMRIFKVPVKNYGVRSDQLRHYATCRKVAGSVPNGVTEMFSLN
jgi:hypothetical protein